MKVLCTLQTGVEAKVFSGNVLNFINIVQLLDSHFAKEWYQ